MAALSKHGGGEEDRERPECVHSSAIQTDLKPTGAGAFSPQLCFSLVGPLPLTPPPPPRIYPIVNLPHCFPISSSTSFLSFTFALPTTGLPHRVANIKKGSSTDRRPMRAERDLPRGITPGRLSPNVCSVS